MSAAKPFYNHNEEHPEQYCPITAELMAIPIIADDGYTYEQEVLEKHIEKNGLISPMTREKISKRSILNRAVKEAIEKSIQEHPELKHQQYQLGSYGRSVASASSALRAAGGAVPDELFLPFAVSVSEAHPIFLSTKHGSSIKVLLYGPPPAKMKFMQHLEVMRHPYAVTQIETIGIDFKMYKEFQIWDTAGQERFRSLTKSYLKEASFILHFGPESWVGDFMDLTRLTGSSPHRAYRHYSLRYDASSGNSEFATEIKGVRGDSIPIAEALGSAAQESRRSSSSVVRFSFVIKNLLETARNFRSEPVPSEPLEEPRKTTCSLM